MCEQGYDILALFIIQFCEIRAFSALRKENFHIVVPVYLKKNLSL
jgi:hypothetical protein